MPDFILLMRGDFDGPEPGWPDYLAKLRAAGCFRGGSAIGPGVALNKSGAREPLDREIVGFIRIEAADLAEAQTYLAGNPVYEAGGTVEVRSLPFDDA